MSVQMGPSARFFPGTVLVSVFLYSVLFGCSRYSGSFIKSHEEAGAIVGSYRTGQLTEGRFLDSWPMLENKPGEKYGWVWGIMKTASSRLKHQETHSYWLGYFESDVTSFTRQRGGFVTVRDSSGTHILQPSAETVVQEHWIGRNVWRLDFQDSVLVALESAE